MTENEFELFEMIFENDNPGQALCTALDVILSHLARRESSEEQVAVDLRELV